MNQVVDLEGSPEFQALQVAPLSIATDSVEELAQAVRDYRVQAPHLSDRGGEVSKRYGVLKWAMPSGEPGHTFILIGKDGTVKWIRDYGAPENGGRMYVAVDELLKEIRPRLGS